MMAGNGDVEAAKKALLLLLKMARNGAVAAAIKALLHLKWCCSCC
jgi:hypothetical protein